MDLKEIGWSDVDSKYLSRDIIRWMAAVDAELKLLVSL